MSVSNLFPIRSRSAQLIDALIKEHLSELSRVKMLAPTALGKFQIGPERETRKKIILVELIWSERTIGLSKNTLRDLGYFKCSCLVTGRTSIA